MAISRKYIWTTVAVVLLLILQYRLWFDDSGVAATHALKEQTESLQQTNTEQAAINQLLMNDVMDLRHGQNLLEETAREDLGLIKEGETFILFSEPDSFSGSHVDSKLLPKPSSAND
ncbi:MAG: septum formation initiator family protein [Oleibacter sp.]|nr:septum formation initiator family protein [Thalassolituus sp.]